MIFVLGKKGNLGVECDVDGCTLRLNGRKPTEVALLHSSAGGSGVEDAAPDWRATPESVRRQAHRRGWACDVDGDRCPNHVHSKGLPKKTNVGRGI